jgi:hypothetical protein
MNVYNQIVSKIIKEQELLMGPVAWYEASKVSGLRIDDKAQGSVAIETGLDSKVVIDNLVRQYSNLFGRAGLEVCKEAVAVLVADLSPTEIPSSLK